MRIGSQPTDRFWRELINKVPRLLLRREIVFLAAAGLIFLMGVGVQRLGYVDRTWQSVKQLRELPQIVQNVAVRPASLTIDIKHRHAVQIEAKRQQAIADGVLVASADDFVPATIRFEGGSVPVKIRLKGDLKEHWASEKWSFRVVTKGDRTILGMKQFSIQRPDARDFLYEMIYHRALAREGLIGLRYDFVDVTINGVNKGVFALEEHFDKRLLENNQRREGPIVRFGEDLFWHEAREQGYLSGLSGRRALSGEGSFFASNIDGFQSGRWLENETLRGQYLAAMQLLEAFRRGDLPASEVFDVKQLGTYLALSDMLRAEHATLWRNIRFYYNPVSARLEPIGFDGTQIYASYRGVMPMLNWDFQKSGDFYDHQLYTEFFADIEIYEAYLRALERISAPGYLEDFLAELDQEIKRSEIIIRRDVPHFRYSPEPLFEARRFVRSMITPAKAVQAHLVRQDSERVVLDVGNLHLFPMELLAVSRDGAGWTGVPDATILPGRVPDQMVDYRRMAIAAPEAVPGEPGAEAASPIRLRYRVLGTERIMENDVAALPARAAAVPAGLMREMPNLERFDFVEVDDKAGQIVIPAGEWLISENMIVPAGFRLVAGPATKIVLTNSASIVSRSPIDFRGTEENPIQLAGADGSAGGFMVVDVDETSVLEYVVFDGLGEPGGSGLNITGAVTFFRAPVTIRESHFLNAQAEDALNVIQSRFDISASTFHNTRSDALDVDFGEGVITNSRFEALGNDAVDVSGTVVTVRNLLVRDAGDKAISAGENSRLSGDTIEISSSNVGVASKDLSEVRLEDVNVTATDIGLAAYQKKPEFGPGTIIVRGVRFDGVAREHWIEERSFLMFNGRHVDGTEADPGPVFYPGES